MATKLFLRNTTNNAITDTGDGVVYDMVITAGAGADTGVVATVDGDVVQVQWTKTSGGLTMAWISGRVPAGGFTLTSVAVSIWGIESNMSANAGARIRVYRYQPGTPTITELGGPFDDEVEIGTSNAELTWTANVNDTAFSENDRILVRFYIEDPLALTMAAGHTCTLTFNAADAATGDSFIEIAETVTFKTDAIISGPHAATAIGVGARAVSTILGARAATATGVGGYADNVIFAVSRAATAIGVGAATALSVFGSVSTAVATGVGAIVTHNLYARTLAAVATGVGAISKVVSVIRAATAIGVGGQSSEFIDGGGGGGGGGPNQKHHIKRYRHHFSHGA